MTDNETERLADEIIDTWREEVYVTLSYRQAYILHNILRHHLLKLEYPEVAP